MRFGVRPDLILVTLARRGLLTPNLPHRTALQVLRLQQWGYGLAGEVRSAAAVSGSRIAVADESCRLSYADLVALGDRLAVVIGGRLGGDSADPRACCGDDAADRTAGECGGVGRLGLLAPNGTDFVLAAYAASVLGLDLVLINTGMTARQVAQTCLRYQVEMLLVDDGYAERAVEVPRRLDLGEAVAAARALAYPLAGGGLRPPARTGRVIVLTSGTTGTPKGAARPEPGGLTNLVSILERIPLHTGDRMVISAPVFHTWGFAALQLGFALRATITLRQDSDPAATLEALARQETQAWIAVPVMIQRLLEHHRHHPVALPDLRVVAVSGSRLPPGLSTGFLDTFGPVLYSLYGSTEVSWATIATPQDLRADPETAGRPPSGTRVLVLDDHGMPVPEGSIGRLYVGHDLLFEGYLGGGSPETSDGLMATGDLGMRVDGRFRVTGRADQMIISGGENVYPQELESALLMLPGVADAVAVGVPDDTFGARLVAYVVPQPGSGLTPVQVEAGLSGQVARHVRPREVYVVDALPRNATGKIDLAALRLR